ncbi:YkgJ family cysteine cluster protein [Hyalangium rubrum]|uniref:YkgJ family cysteine cluster protein n=1 Tax=Hyalangium rubrum TaxID=3103134 RepID=A0ABU5H5J2_9BACT|nr:YkgJ family cysteine cluster protein [Hyalangium sp. s54d21]MDY7228027.1 YkgJ family cysteine cluster protein [Hyalangium sp. s54d21]
MPFSTLCQRCGLCCDGNLFASVPLRKAEVATMQRLSLSVMETPEGTPSLVQRCTALDGRCCTVYAERPEACRRYRCYLLMAMAEGEVSLDEALAVVDGAHARIQAVEALLAPSSEEAPQAVLQRARRDDLPENGGPLPPEARTAWEQANAYLDRHFRGRHGRG